MGVSLQEFVRLAKHRCVIERDYLELEQEQGLGHFGGRPWRSFRHNATLCIAAYGFLVAEKSRFPPRPALGRWSWRRPGRRQTTGRGAAGKGQERCEVFSIASLPRKFAELLMRQLSYCPLFGARPLGLVLLNVPNKSQSIFL